MPSSAHRPLIATFPKTVLAALTVLATCAIPAALQAQSGPPPTERQDVTEVFFGQTVTDPYRWLENWHEAKAADWLKAQDTYTRSALTAIPGREKFLARVKIARHRQHSCAQRAGLGRKALLSQSRSRRRQCQALCERG